jgi:hypothetical protein
VGSACQSWLVGGQPILVRNPIDVTFHRFQGEFGLGAQFAFGYFLLMADCEIGLAAGDDERTIRRADERTAIIANLERQGVGLAVQRLVAVTSLSWVVRFSTLQR